ncbi:hypothetical protein JCM18882A_34610 [Brevibacterium metallidurans]|uniref:Uncharacterized protein n=1 Tax=Brevibacterium metallidurans TaxID=1482676 RepID=A0ABN0SSV9_9MICO
MRLDHLLSKEHTNMVPTNEPIPWFGWVAQGWNITYLPLILLVVVRFVP